MSDVVILRQQSVVTLVPGSGGSGIVVEQRDVPTTVLIQREGIPGPRGDTGPTGSVGDPFVFTPVSPSTIWNISHNLDRYPIVTVLDNAGREVLPEVTYLDRNIVRLDFAVNMTGTAYLY